jgi:enamine deaminase RidA (YjgF/YER057c/UK114 family)
MLTAAQCFDDCRLQIADRGLETKIKAVCSYLIRNPKSEIIKMPFTYINPESLGAPLGYSNGVLTETGGRLLFIAGQIAWDARQQIVSDDFVAQFDQALANVITVVNEAGGTAEQIARLMIYVTDKAEYKKRTREIGESYRARMGKHFPAMALVEVKSLLDDNARVEIEGVAYL